MDNMTADQPQFQTSVDVKLDYIQRDITKIQLDIGIIKNDFVSRREFKEGLTEIRNEYGPIKKVLYWIMGAIGLTVVGALMKLILIK
jgi:hypothetical protein